MRIPKPNKSTTFSLIQEIALWISREATPRRTAFLAPAIERTFFFAIFAVEMIPQEMGEVVVILNFKLI